MVELNLKAHQQSQCHVEIDNVGKITFVSYKTPVVEAVRVDGTSYTVMGFNASDYNQSWNNNRVKEDSPYSATTSRQISWFLSEYFPTLTIADIKTSATKGVVLHSTLTKDIRGYV